MSNRFGCGITTKFEDKLERSMAATDSMSPALKECVHEFGLAIVNACLCAKVTDPRRIRQLVFEIWEGARQPSQRREPMGTLDWLLLQAGAQISAATLLRILESNSMAIVPLTPSREMVEASMAEVSGFNLKVTKKDKHKIRLVAAIKAAVSHFRPQLLKAESNLSVANCTSATQPAAPQVHKSSNLKGAA